MGKIPNGRGRDVRKYTGSVGFERRVGVVAGAVAYVEIACGGARDGDLQAMEGSSGLLILRIISEDILCAQILADARKGLVEAAIVHVEALAAGLLGEGDERVLAAGVAAGAGGNGHVDEAVDHDFIAEGLLECFGVGGGFDGVAAVGDDHQHLASIELAEAMRTEMDGVVEGGGIAAAEHAKATIDLAHLVGELAAHDHVGGEFDEAHLVLWPHEGVDEVFGGVSLDGAIFEDAAAGVDGEGEIEGHLRFTLEDFDFLRAAVFGEMEVFAGETADDGTGLVSNVDDYVHELDVDVEGGRRGVGLGLRVGERQCDEKQEYRNGGFETAQ